MRRPLFILLILLSLLSQWAWVEHAYHEHDADEVCEICLIGQAQTHAATASVLPLLSAPTERFERPLSLRPVAHQPRSRQNIRAPPPYSNTQS